MSNVWVLIESCKGENGWNSIRPDPGDVHGPINQGGKEAWKGGQDEASETRQQQARKLIRAFRKDLWMWHIPSTTTMCLAVVKGGEGGRLGQSLTWPLT